MHIFGQEIREPGEAPCGNGKNVSQACNRSSEAAMLLYPVLFSLFCMMRCHKAQTIHITKHHQIATTNDGWQEPER